MPRWTVIENMKQKNSMQPGMTLIELIVVIAIIATLTVLVYPSFTRAKLESRRSEAHSGLLALEGIIERYLAENNKANFDTNDLALTQFADYDTASSSAILTKSGYYRLTITPDSTGYTITATATIDNTLTSCDTSGNENSLQCQDTECREIIIDHGEHHSKNSLGVEVDAASTKCW